MILLNIHQGDDKPASLAKKLGITIQGIQYHTRILRKKGYIDENYKITKEGFHALESGLLALKEFVGGSLAKIDDLTTWEAIASTEVKAGNQVFVGMRDGYLHCFNDGNGHNTTGIAKNDARKGEIVLVSNLSGLISVPVCSVNIFIISTPESKAEDEELNKLLTNGHNIIITTGELAHVYAMKRGIKEDSRFGSLHSAFDAATRGLDAVIFMSDRRFHYEVSEMHELQLKFPEVPLKIKYL
ncbi:MAG: hypothetical protein QXV22_02250 [Thermoplasmataceae archaeon]